MFFLHRVARRVFGTHSASHKPNRGSPWIRRLLAEPLEDRRLLSVVGLTIADRQDVPQAATVVADLGASCEPLLNTYAGQSGGGVTPSGGNFYPSSQILNNGHGVDVALGDLNGDGHMDAFTINPADGIKVWINNGYGSCYTSFTDNNQSRGSGTVVALGDVDGDGYLDAVTGSSESSYNCLWLNGGDYKGAFCEMYPHLDISSAVYDLELADFDGDGDLDLFVTCGTDSGVTNNLVYFNQGPWTFFTDSGQRLGVGRGSGSAVGDVDGDGDLDVVVTATSGDSGNKVWLNNGSGVFAAGPQNLGSSRDVALGDLDGDGDLDVLLLDASTCSEWRNDGFGNFTDSGQSLAASDATHVVLGDVEGDGDLDAIVTSPSGDSGNKVWLNNGSGVFAAGPQNLGSSRDVALGDLSGDGTLDAFTVQGSSSTDRVWFNQDFDFGDAPASYPTLLADDGARHVVGNLYLGSQVGSEADGRPTANADGDTGDDGVTFNGPLMPGTTTSITVKASGDGWLDAWIDLDRNSSWLDAGEKFLDIVQVHAGDNSLKLPVPSGVASGDTFVRFRLRSSGGLLPTGPAADGEVEDYRVTILPPSATIRGTKFNDLDKDGVRDDGEPGLADWTIYLDLNWNGRMDDDEPRTTTLADNPATSDNEAGTYAFTGLASGLYSVAEVTQTDWEQTLPHFASQIMRVSVAADGAQGNASSFSPAISADGRYVAFASDASNLVPDDTNGVFDIFVCDRQTGAIERVSVASDGSQGDRESFNCSISGDGRYVAFASRANLVPGDVHNHSYIYVHDRVTGSTERITQAPDGTPGNGGSQYCSISADGRCVAFESEATNLVSGDGNNFADVFVYDRQAHTTVLASFVSGGIQANYSSGMPSLSADGRYVAFESGASNLVSNDSNNAQDVFVCDWKSHAIERISVDSDGNQANYGSGMPSLSADGRCVTFGSGADNLVPNDTNGQYDVFVCNLQTHAVERVSMATDGTQGDGPSGSSTISADGRYVAFCSEATNLAPSDTNNESDVFVYDRQTGAIEIVSRAYDGLPALDDCYPAAISANGAYVVFESWAWNLVPGDTNQMYDIFVAPTATTSTDAQGVALVPGQMVQGVDFGNRRLLLDFGDAPEPAYPTLLAHDGARHTIRSLHLGSLIDDEPDGQPTADAGGDDAHGQGDDDGVTFDGPIVLGRMASFSVVASGAGKLDAWIDLDHSDGWEADEQFLLSEAVVAGANHLSLVVPLGAEIGTTFVRLRLSTAGGLSPTGRASDGEVEDYQVFIDRTPQSDAGGPYWIESGQHLLLDGAASSDPDLGDSIASYRWDLDDDGAFDDAEGATPCVPWENLQELAANTLLPVRLQVTDTHGATEVAATTLNIHRNRAPIHIALDHAIVAENQPVNALVGSLSSIDPDEDTQFTYTLVDGAGDNGRFSIPDGTNQLRTAYAFDFEVRSQYTVYVRSTDQGGAAYEQSLTIAIADVDDTPPTIREIGPGEGQADPTNVSSIRFKVVFSEWVTGFAAADVGLSGTAGPTTATVMPVGGDGTTYEVTVGGMIASGTVVIGVPAGVVADRADNLNEAGLESSSVLYDVIPPSADLADPAVDGLVVDTVMNARQYIDVTFSDANGLNESSIVDSAAEFALGGAASARVTVNGVPQWIGGTTYRYSLTGTFGRGPVDVVFVAGSFADRAGNTNPAATRRFYVVPTISIGDPAPITEGDRGSKSLSFIVRLSGGSSQTITVQYSTADNGSALSGKDYTAIANGTLIFKPGITVQKINVPVLGDRMKELTETFLVNLAAPTKSVLADDGAIGTISDNDPLPTVAINNVSLQEGSAGTTAFTFNVTLSTASGLPVTMQCSTADNTAKTADSDYLAVDTGITIPAGQTKQSITVLVNGDTMYEANETFKVNLIDPQGATIARGKGVGTGTIVNEDMKPKVSIGNGTLITDAAGTRAEFVVRLSDLSGLTATVKYVTANGTARSGLDYRTTQGSLTFAIGQTVQTISVPIVGDPWLKAGKNFFATLSAPKQATLGSPTKGTFVFEGQPPGLSSLVDALAAARRRASRTSSPQCGPAVDAAIRLLMLSGPTASESS